MPTVLRVGPYRFFFYASDGAEPPHVHIEAGSNVAKFWLIPVRLQNSGGFNRHEIRQIERLVQQYAQRLIRAWNDFFNG